MWTRTLIGSALLCAMTAFGQLRTNVVLEHDYDVKQLTNVWFFYYGSPDPAAPIATWQLVGVNVGRTNSATPTNITVALQPQAYFFVARASNFWGLSTNFSNVAATPEPPRSDCLLRLR